MKKTLFLSIVVACCVPAIALAETSIECHNNTQLVCSGDTAEIERILDPKNKIDDRCAKLREASKGKSCRSKMGELSSPPLNDEASYEFLMDCKVPRFDSNSLFKCGL